MGYYEDHSPIVGLFNELISWGTMGKRLSPKELLTKNGIAIDYVKQSRHIVTGTKEPRQRFEDMIRVLKKVDFPIGSTDVVILPKVRFPRKDVGQNSEILYLLSRGVSNNTGFSKNGLDLQHDYLSQTAVLAKELGKEPERLTLGDLGQAILVGSFDIRLR